MSRDLSSMYYTKFMQIVLGLPHITSIKSSIETHTITLKGVMAMDQ
jgi:hypothetical protein